MEEDKVILKIEISKNGCNRTLMCGGTIAMAKILICEMEQIKMTLLQDLEKRQDEESEKNEGNT